MGDQHVAEQTNPAYGMRDPAFPVFVGDYIGFQLEHEQQKKPGGFVDAIGELAGPVKKG